MQEQNPDENYVNTTHWDPVRRSCRRPRLSSEFLVLKAENSSLLFQHTFRPTTRTESGCYTVPQLALSLEDPQCLQKVQDHLRILTSKLISKIHWCHFFSGVCVWVLFQAGPERWTLRSHSKSPSPSQRSLSPPGSPSSPMRRLVLSPSPSPLTQSECVHIDLSFIYFLINKAQKS